MMKKHKKNIFFFFPVAIFYFSILKFDVDFRIIKTKKNQIHMNMNKNSDQQELN